VHEDFFGGVFINSTYRWNGPKVELIEENGTVSGSANPDCGFTEYCSRLIDGQMRATASRASGCSNGPTTPLVCSPTAPPLPVTRKNPWRFRGSDPIVAAERIDSAFCRI